MNIPKRDINEINEEKIVDQIRSLGIDTIVEAGEGHTGIVLGSAPILYTLYAHHMRIDPDDAKFFNRDRFILSCGHGSALLYSVLHMAGFDISIDDLKRYRKIDSNTPGYPVTGLTSGVDASTGMLGQGFATAVGMAIAERNLEERYNKNKVDIIDFNTYVLCSDGDLMEGVSYEAASLAGTLKLNKLIALYDCNNLIGDGDASVTFNEDITMRFTSMGWNVLNVNDGNNISDINDAINAAKECNDKPSIIIVKTLNGKFSKFNNINIINENNAEDIDVTEVKSDLDVRDIPFTLSKDAVDDFRLLISTRCSKLVDKWNKNLEKLDENDRVEIVKFSENKHNFDFKDLVFEASEDGMESPVVTSTKVLNSISKLSPFIIGGCADSFEANSSFIEDGGIFSSNNYLGKNISFGMREHAMGAILNGLSLCGFIPYCATYLAFSEYMFPAIRFASMMNLKNIYLFNHDSISIGGDGAAHQPNEQLALLRCMPNLEVFRPADCNEVLGTYRAIVESCDGPVAISLSNENLKILESTKVGEVSRGGYVVYDCDRKLSGILIASGEEVHTAIEVAKRLFSKGIDVRVVSMPNIDRFKKQDSQYIESVLPVEVRKIVIEKASSMSWNSIVFNEKYLITLDQFGVSGDSSDVLKKYGFDVDSLEEKVEDLFK